MAAAFARLQEILALPPSALQGVPDRADELLASLKITTVKDLAGYKYYKIAKAVATLAGTEASGPLPLPCLALPAVCAAHRQAGLWWWRWFVWQHCNHNCCLCHQNRT